MYFLIVVKAFSFRPHCQARERVAEGQVENMTQPSRLYPDSELLREKLPCFYLKLLPQ